MYREKRQKKRLDYRIIHCITAWNAGMIINKMSNMATPGITADISHALSKRIKDNYNHTKKY
jgi:hypothetical protein